jgi:hypothetical protein
MRPGRGWRPGYVLATTQSAMLSVRRIRFVGHQTRLLVVTFYT